TTDGFQIAEADLQLRGPGDLEGTQQSGIAFNMRIANLATDGQILSMARDYANELLDADPDISKPENAVAAEQLRLLFSKTIDWSRIS
ncbi:MAG: ATP-dependent DNA helicase RecG, partial [Candidatus Limisoma sp.]|nr:ATP-dependent DNA helicase RecG [Bacteroidales bacterium]MDY5892966.1 ATP-dependent DNA helicase RecG [Candidatus Limisoma sp.]